MKNLIWLVLGLAVLIAIVTVLKAKQQGGSARKLDVRKKDLLSKREQGMFFRLTSTFPEHVVLSQVCFSALLRSNQRGTRNRYSQKFADFVLCTKAFDVLAVIELDDSSHKGREREDGDRDGWLTAAGYRVVRYANTPDTAKLLADFPSSP
ncbi:DUF2726 domain-containing protein [Polaromonas sp.]|uniref:DUF2726 domain-containing protein n=1 Tax=Polaromonas sp. TaxID=1869339 RepID=UPI00326438ED